MAFLDKVIQENSTCGAAGCQTAIKRTYYCQCRKCGKAFCSSHVMPRSHDCENADAAMPAESHHSYAMAARAGTASSQTKAKMKQALQEK
mmetsp:Transcript_18942/g.25666  ORF Transcript_18942/g.25666 Transcript_18942/m.25666 type:complete len:90 (-) Transcript_18942:129-398(-)